METPLNLTKLLQLATLNAVNLVLVGNYARIEIIYRG